VRLKMLGCGKRRMTLTIIWAVDERKAGAEGGRGGDVVELEG
jgi:hypothetical protein